MHIPDGFLDAKTWISTAALSAGALSYGLTQTNKELHEKQIPLMGAMGAFVFAAQMVNFPVAGGTSGHLLGGALLALTMGPWPACIIMATIVGLQAFFFNDGGITVLGANIFNMAVLAPLTAYWVYRLLSRFTFPRPLKVFLAAWVSTMVAATATALELAFSNTIALKLVLPAMLGWHSLIGIGEGLITAGVIVYLTSTQGGLFLSMGRKAGESNV